MTDSQHDTMIFILIALTAGAVLGAVVTLVGCGGAEFTGIPEVGVKSDVGATGPEIFAPEASEVFEAGVPDAHREHDAHDELSIVNTPDAATVETSVKLEASACDIDACSPRCPGNNLPCCTAAGTCGCLDFGPVCI